MSSFLALTTAFYGKRATVNNSSIYFRPRTIARYLFDNVSTKVVPGQQDRAVPVLRPLLTLDDTIKQFACNRVDCFTMRNAPEGRGIPECKHSKVWDARGKDMLGPNRTVLCRPGVDWSRTKPVNQDNANRKESSALIILPFPAQFRAGRHTHSRQGVPPLCERSSTRVRAQSCLRRDRALAAGGLPRDIFRRLGCPLLNEGAKIQSSAVVAEDGMEGKRQQ